MNITFSPEHNGELRIDGKPAGTFDGKDYEPAEGLTKKEIAAVSKFLRGLAEASPGGGEVSGSAPSPGDSKPATACPPMDPSLGDKTPEVVEWYRDNQPEEFARRYRGRKTHLGRIG